MDREQRDAASYGSDIKEQRLAAAKTSLPVAVLLRELFCLFIGRPLGVPWGPKSSAVHEKHIRIFISVSYFAAFQSGKTLNNINLISHALLVCCEMNSCQKSALISLSLPFLFSRLL